MAHPCDETSLKGAVEAAELGIMTPILVGPRARIVALAAQFQLDISPYEIVDAPHSHAAADLAVQLAREGLTVARLKGGDPQIFGRGSEEAEAARAAGVPVSYIPGITSAQGAAASTGVPLTHRGLATGVRYVTGHRAKDATLDLDWASLASEETTLVVYMGAGNIAEIARNLMQHGLPGNLPVLAISSATTPRETRLMSALGRIGADVARVQPDAPVLFVIGHVAGLYPAIAAMDAALCEGAGMAAYA